MYVVVVFMYILFLYFVLIVFRIVRGFVYIIIVKYLQSIFIVFKIEKLKYIMLSGKVIYFL